MRRSQKRPTAGDNPVTSEISGHHVCRMHSNGVTKAVAKRNVAEQKAAKAISRESLVPVSDPVAALMALAAEALRWKDSIRSEVGVGFSAVYFAGHLPHTPEHAATS